MLRRLSTVVIAILMVGLTTTAQATAGAATGGGTVHINGNLHCC